ncbi:tumor necrosis factor ligand superfamily member 14-like [Arapaima gigas]
MEVSSQCPQVFVVDSQASAPRSPFLAPRCGTGMAWRLLWLLVGLALLGVLVEGLFIYHLYQKPLVSNPYPGPRATRHSSLTLLLGHASHTHLTHLTHLTNLNKLSHITYTFTSAHLQQFSLYGKGFSWGEFGDAFVYGMVVKNNGLLVQTEGYYFIYSKVHFSEVNCSIFKHTVLRYTQRYAGVIELMKAKHFHCQGRKLEGMRNSYLGGIFHLHTNDSITVKVEDSSQIRLQETADNFFGAYMI